MAVQDKTTLKSYFTTGARPTQSNFDDLIDSSVRNNLTTDWEELWCILRFVSGSWQFLVDANHAQVGFASLNHPNATTLQLVLNKTYTKVGASSVQGDSVYMAAGLMFTESSMGLNTIDIKGYSFIGGVSTPVDMTNPAEVGLANSNIDVMLRMRL